MKQVHLGTPQNPAVYLSEVPTHIPLFLKREGKLVGMIVNEKEAGTNRWIGRTGGAFGISGHFTTREACVKEALIYGYELTIED